MSDYCQDRDLLSIEPIVFLGGGFPGQELTAGQGGELAGTTFTAATGEFVAAGVAAGMVLCSYATIPAEGAAGEIISVDSATTLTVSVLRADTSGPAVPPPAQSDVAFHVRTYAAQIRTVCDALDEKLRRLSETVGDGEAAFCDPAQLRTVAAYGVLADVFTARAAGASAADANWIKAQHYRRLQADVQSRLRMGVDLNQDGVADATFEVGNIRLRRV